MLFLILFSLVLYSEELGVCEFPNCFDCTETTCSGCSSKHVWNPHLEKCVECKPGSCFMCPTEESCVACDPTFKFNDPETIEEDYEGGLAFCTKCSPNKNMCGTCATKSDCGACAAEASDKFYWVENRGCVKCESPFCQNCPTQAACEECDPKGKQWNWNEEEEHCGYCKYPSCFECRSEDRCLACGIDEFIWHVDIDPETEETSSECIKCALGSCTKCPTQETCEACHKDYVWGESESGFNKRCAICKPGECDECPTEESCLACNENNVFTDNYGYTSCDICNKDAAKKGGCEGCPDEETCSACSAISVSNKGNSFDFQYFGGCEECSYENDHCDACNTEESCLACHSTALWDADNEDCDIGCGRIVYEGYGAWTDCEDCPTKERCEKCGGGEYVWEEESQECLPCGIVDYYSMRIRRCGECPTADSCSTCAKKNQPLKDSPNPYFALLYGSTYEWYDYGEETVCRPLTCQHLSAEQCSSDPMCAKFYGSGGDVDNYECFWCNEDIPRWGCSICSNENTCTTCGGQWDPDGVLPMSSELGIDGACTNCQWDKENPGYSCMQCDNSPDCVTCGGIWNYRNDYYDYFRRSYIDDVRRQGYGGRGYGYLYSFYSECRVPCKDRHRCRACVKPFAADGVGYYSMSWRSDYCLVPEYYLVPQWRTFNGQVIYSTCEEANENAFTSVSYMFDNCMKGCHQHRTVSHPFLGHEYEVTLGIDYCDRCFERVSGGGGTTCIECEEGFELDEDGDCVERPASLLCPDEHCMKCEQTDKEECVICHMGYTKVRGKCVHNSKVDQAAIVGGVLGGIFGGLAIVALIICLCCCCIICCCIMQAKKRDDEMEMEVATKE